MATNTITDLSKFTQQLEALYKNKEAAPVIGQLIILAAVGIIADVAHKAMANKYSFNLKTSNFEINLQPPAKPQKLGCTKQALPSTEETRPATEEEAAAQGA